MKVEYVCEKCGKKYDTENKAKNCEAEHDVLERKKATLKELKETLETRINGLVNKYIEAYGEYPPIKLNEENYKKLYSSTSERIDNLLRLVERMWG